MNITSHLNGLGIPLPKPLVAVADLRAALLDNVVVSDGGELAAFASKIRSGTLTPADVETELRALGEVLAFRQALTITRDDIHRSLEYAEKVALLESGPEVYVALKSIVAEHGRLLCDAVAIVGPEPDSSLLVRLGKGAGASMDAYLSSLAVLRQAEDIVNEIYVVRGGVRRAAPITWIDLAALKTHADLDRVAETFGKFPKIAHAGFGIVLNTDDEIAAAMQRIGPRETTAAATGDRPMVTTGP